MKCHTFLNIFLILTLLLTTACSQDESVSQVCESGYSMVADEDYEKSIPVLTECINSDKSTPGMKLNAYINRARAYFSVNNYSKAVEDQESAFRLADENSYKIPQDNLYYELINYGLYLRSSGKITESLLPLRRAEEIDHAKGRTLMMTQYHIGWTLQELNRHQEAVDAFSKGIPTQPDYIYAYYRRGLSFEAMGKKESAQADFLMAGKLYKASVQKHGMDEKTHPVINLLIDKLKEYDAL